MLSSGVVVCEVVKELVEKFERNGTEIGRGKEFRSENIAGMSKGKEKKAIEAER